MKAAALLATLGLVSQVLGLTPAQWRSQSIYQDLTDRFARTDGSTTAACNANNGDYCGGSWQGIISHLDYIQNMGFTAIWISPVVENLPQDTSDGAGYHGYWAQNIYAVNSNFGAASDLVALSSALHKRGMYLMVDVVTNHMGYTGCGTCVDYSVFNPFNQQSYFHPYCPIDYSNSTSELVCWEGDNTVSLPDLRTENTNVRSMWNTWIGQLVQNYTIDGLRIDSCTEVEQSFFPGFQSAASGIHVLGEVFNGDPNVFCPYQNYMSGMLNYPSYYWITQAFESTSGSISNLVNGINTLINGCSDTTLLGSFLENHDNPRFPSLTQDISLTENAIGFTILADGIPIIYEGQEQHYSGSSVPTNREAVWLSGYSTTSTLYNYIATVNQIRNHAIFADSSYTTYKAQAVYSDGATIVMCKGSTGSQVVSVFSNKGANGNSYTLTVDSAQTGYSANQGLVELLGCTSYTTDGSGNLNVAMANGLPRIFYPSSKLVGSGICTSALGGSTSTLSTATKPATSAPGCASATAIAITFKEAVTTTYGQSIKIAGSVGQLGDWNPASAIPLSASAYTSSNPLWQGTVNFTPGEVIQYKFINVGTDGTVTWEADPNHTYTVPAGCTSTATVSSSWQT